MESVSNTPHTTSEDGNLRGPLAGPYNEQGCQTCENPPLDPPSEPTVPPPPQRSATRQLLHYDTKTKPGTHSAWTLTDSFLSCSFLRRGPSARVIGQERKKQHKTTTRKAWEEKRVGIKRTWHPRVGEGGHHWPDTQGLGRMATTNLTPKGWRGWPPPTRVCGDASTIDDQRETRLSAFNKHSVRPRKIAILFWAIVHYVGHRRSCGAQLTKVTIQFLKFGNIFAIWVSVTPFPAFWGHFLAKYNGRK